MNREGLAWQGACSNYNIIQNLIRPPPWSTIFCPLHVATEHVRRTLFVEKVSLPVTARRILPVSRGRGVSTALGYCIEILSLQSCIRSSFREITRTKLLQSVEKRSAFYWCKNGIFCRSGVGLDFYENVTKKVDRSRVSFEKKEKYERMLRCNKRKEFHL